jgi:hypothetical protein
MEILVTRKWRSPKSTVSTVKVDGQPHQFILEDRDRGLTSEMNLDDIKREKVYGGTAIPTGRYRVLVTMSARFKRMLPLLVGVPGYSGIRIHPGNRHVDTDGCLLPGKTFWSEAGDYAIGTSLTACQDLQAKIKAAIKRGEEVWMTITREYTT